LAGASALAINAALTGAIVVVPKQALASCQVVSGSDATLGSSISCFTWNDHSVMLPAAGRWRARNTAISNLGNAVGSLTNSGTISGAVFGINNSGAIGPINNSGTISGSLISTTSRRSPSLTTPVAAQSAETMTSTITAARSARLLTAG